MTMDWVTTPEEAFGALVDDYTRRVHAAVFLLMTQRAPEIENWMKANAPWTDRTGNARQSLNARAINSIAEVVVLLAHGMDYGFWLEVANAGRYAIITPAIDYWAPKLLADLQAMLR